MEKDYQRTPTGRNVAIRRLYKTGKWSMEKLAGKYNISKARVHQIVRKQLADCTVLDK